MDSEFPDPDEEFDLVHQDEYEVLREIEGRQDLEKKNDLPEPPKTQSIPQEVPKNVQEKECNVPTTSKSDWEEDFMSDSTRKRNYEELLFGDISDVLDIDDFEPREKKPRWNQPKEVIKLVLDTREKFQEHGTGVQAKKKLLESEKRNTISLKIPPWNFIAVTRPYDSQRIYVRIKSEKDSVDKNVRPISNLLSVPYSQLKAQAEEILVKNVERASKPPPEISVNESFKSDELWVDKYRPRSYPELLSDESVNRHFLHWLKLWDKIVFNRNFVPVIKKKQLPAFGNKKFMNDKPVEEVDSKGLPIHRIALLSGPPGLGKTTLAHLAARHAGYNVVEINASDERSPEAFRQTLLASTQMRAVMGHDPRPNCVILDEIDGAPAASIDLLLKFIQGKLVPRGKKDKGKAEKETLSCHRPVICICNEPYTPSLRALRAVALIIPVPEVSPARLADRLMEVSRRERLKVNPDALLKLAEISGCDVRSCLGALQYMGGANSTNILSFALKDTRKGLFDSWRQIFTVPFDRSGILPSSKRIRTILKTVQSGESEKLAQGIFHNYPEICSDKLDRLSTSLEWFQFFDEISSLVASRQVWSVMRYTNYAFVTWHFNFSKLRSSKLSYPSVVFEVNQKIARSVGILRTVQRSCGYDVITLAMDIAPFLPDLLSPRLRTVSGHLHSSKERADIDRLVNILLEFGLTLRQEKSIDGVYEYKLDPDIFEVGIFPGCKVRRALAYAVKQIIVQELEAERLRRAASITGISKSSTENEAKNNSNSSAKNQTGNEANNVPNEKSKIPEKPKPSDISLKEIKYKDFFGRPVTVEQDKQNKEQDRRRNKMSPRSDKTSVSLRDFLTKHGIWYKYKEGFSNAVRRNVIMEELL